MDQKLNNLSRREAQGQVNYQSNVSTDKQQQSSDKQPTFLPDVIGDSNISLRQKPPVPNKPNEIAPSLRDQVCHALILRAKLTLESKFKKWKRDTKLCKLA